MTTGDSPIEPTGDDPVDDRPDSDRDDAWKKVTSDFAGLGSRVRSFFEERDGDATAAEQAQESIQDLATAAERAAKALGAAFRDDDVQQQAKTAMTSLVDAIGVSVKDLTDRLSSHREDPADE